MTNGVYIPEGTYLTKAQVAEQRGVIQQTAQQWIDKGWLPTIYIPGLGYIINADDLAKFQPPKPGPRKPKTT